MIKLNFNKVSLDQGCRVYLLSISFIILIQILMSIIVQIFSINPYGIYFNIIGMIILQFANILALFIILYHKKTKNSISKNTLKMKNNDSKSNYFFILFLLAFLVALSCLYTFGSLNTLFDYILKVLHYNTSSFTIKNIYEGIFAFIPMCILAPIFEESVYRGALMHGLSKNFTKTQAIFISALAFAFMHMNPEQLFYQFTLGIIMGYMVFESGTILFSIFIHAFNNFIPLFYMIFINNTTDVDMTLPSVILYTAISCCIGIGIFILFRKLIIFLKSKYVINTNIEEFETDVFKDNFNFSINYKTNELNLSLKIKENKKSNFYKMKNFYFAISLCLFMFILKFVSGFLG